MKKLLISLMLLGAVNAVFSQDSIDVETLPYQNIIPAGNSVWHFDAADSDDEGYLSEATYIQPILRSSTTLYPRSTTYNLVLGATSQSGTYKLYVNGSGYFNSSLHLNSGVYFYNDLASIVSDGSGVLYLRDAVTGVKSLAELAAGTSTSVRNGLTTSSGYVEFGGTLIKNTSVYTNGYNLLLGSSGTYLSVAESLGYIYLYGSNKAVISSKAIDINGSEGFRLYSNGLTNTIRYYDNTTTPYGITIPDYLTYYTNILSANKLDAVATIGMVTDLIADSAGVGAGVGTYIDGSADAKDTVWMPVVVNHYSTRDFDGTDSVDYIPLVIDTLADDDYLVTYSLTSAIINAGTDITLVASPGSGYAIDPYRYKISLAAGTAYSAGSAATLELGTNTVISLTDDNLGLDETTITNIAGNIEYEIAASVTNTALSLDFSTHTGGTSRDGYIKVWYKITEE